MVNLHQLLAIEFCADTRSWNRNALMLIRHVLSRFYAHIGRKDSVLRVCLHWSTFVNVFNTSLAQ